MFVCKCGSKDIFIKESGNHKGLYCSECGKWMRWLGKEELIIAERQIDKHDRKIRNDVIEECLDIIKYYDIWGSYILIEKIEQLKEKE